MAWNMIMIKNFLTFRHHFLSGSNIPGGYATQRLATFNHPLYDHLIHRQEKPKSLKFCCMF